MTDEPGSGIPGRTLENVLRAELGWGEADIAAIPGHLLELHEVREAEPGMSQQGFYGSHAEYGHAPEYGPDGDVDCNCGETFHVQTSAADPYPPVSNAEYELISAEQLSGLPFPDLAEPADVDAWRAEHADLIERGEAAIAAEAAAVRTAAEIEPEYG